MLLWVLASETMEGAVPYDRDELRFRLRLPKFELSALTRLIKDGFLIATASTCKRMQASAVPETETETEGEKRQSRYISIFDSSRKLFPGIVRGLETEFANLCKKYSDWKEIVPLLLPAVEGQIAARKTKQGFVPPWKNFQTWINNRCWEDVQGGGKAKTIDKQKALELKQSEIRRDMSGYYRGQTKEELEIHRLNPYNQSNWFLIDEILKE